MGLAATHLIIEERRRPNNVSAAGQLANFALWINKEPELRANLTAFASYVAEHAERMPFFIWRDSSVQHFNVRRSAPALFGCCFPLNINALWAPTTWPRSH